MRSDAQGARSRHRPRLSYSKTRAAERLADNRSAEESFWDLDLLPLATGQLGDVEQQVAQRIERMAVEPWDMGSPGRSLLGDVRHKIH